MRWDVVGLVLGWTIRLIALPLMVVFAYSASIGSEGMEYAAKTFLPPAILSLVLGQSLVSLSKNSDASSRVRDREAFASVALGWIPVVAVGALPYWLGGMFYGPFEMRLLVMPRFGKGSGGCCTHGLSQCPDLPQRGQR